MKSGKPLSFPPEAPIWVDPGRLSGAPCFKGTRVPVDSLFTGHGRNLAFCVRLDFRALAEWRSVRTDRRDPIPLRAFDVDAVIFPVLVAAAATVVRRDDAGCFAP
jgi:hypothetical protein